jgi:hypothetical protein
VLASSNGNALVNFGAGTKDVWGDYPAGTAVTTDTLAYPPAIGGTTPNAATFTTLTATGQTSLGGAAGSESLRVAAVSSAANYVQVNGAPTGSNPSLQALGSSGTQQLGLFGRGTGGGVNLGTGSSTMFAVRGVAGSSTVNFLQANASTTGNAVILSSAGSDSNIDIALDPKGTGTVVANGPFTATGQTSLGGVEGSEGLRITSTASAVNYLLGRGQISGNSPSLRGAGSDANVSLFLGSQGAGNVRFLTNSLINEQFRIAHTANAVNYVQVTGAATGNDPTYSAQGSDANVSLRYLSRGAGEHRFATNTAGNIQFRVIHGGSSVVNYLRVYGSAAGSAPVMDVQGIDTNIDLNLNPKGTGTVVANGPFTATGQTSLGGVAGSEGLRVLSTASAARYVQVEGSVSGQPRVQAAGASTPLALSGAGANGLTFWSNSFSTQQFAVSHTASAVNFVQVTGAATGAGPDISAQGSDASIDLRYASKGTSGTHVFRTNGTVRQFQINHTTSAVNFVQVTGAATGAGPIISAQGSDSDVRLNLTSKGTNSIDMLTNSAGTRQFRFFHTASAVNYLQAQGSASGNGLQFSAQGSDTNISQVFQSKGTGAINLAPGSRGVNISNGGTVTALTFTAAGNAYTSFPSLVISAPTTAGGVQATATLNRLFQNIATVANGGTGYTVGNVLTVVGGTPAGAAATLTVSSVSGGVITAVSSTNFAQYTALPANPVSVTGGTGTGATLNLQWSVLTGAGSYTITNAGSGYVEQPTVTFSGGGGSGAAAYAGVGSAPVIRSLAGSGGGSASMSLFTPGGEAVRVTDAGGSLINYWRIQGSPASGGVQLTAAGSDANVSALYSSRGTGSQAFFTNSFAQEQFRVAHTASAVNYVQVTGAATGGAVTISAQGSDTNTGILYFSKGFGSHQFRGYGGNHIFGQFYAAQANPINFLQLGASSAGNAVVVMAAGSDTNIPVVVQPKGTGALQAQQTDSTATGGNARGANAVDWQTSRTTGSQVASGQFSVISGGANNSSGAFASTAGGGTSNTARGNYNVVAGGSSNQADGNFNNTFSAICGGYANVANGYLNFVGGGYGNSTNTTTAATTQSASITSGSTAVTLSGSNASIRVGQLIIATGINTFPPTYVAAISGTSLTLSQNATATNGSVTLNFFTPHGVVAGGGNNQATGAYSFIGGGGDAGTAGNRNVASGDWSTVGGGVRNIATATGATVAGGGISSVSGAISGNTASGLSAFVGGGYGNLASGGASFVGSGFGNTADALFSSVVGGRWGTTRGLVGNTVFAACQDPVASASGVSQAALLIIGVQTTDATATVLRSNNGPASSNNQVILPNNAAYHFRGSVIANVTGAANGAAWSFEGAIMRGANAASTVLIGAPVVNRIAASAGAAAWTIAVTADTTNGGLAVTVTGAASTTIRWVAKLETTEVTF